MRVIWCLSRQISKDLFRKGLRYWATSACREQWEERITQMTLWLWKWRGCEGWLQQRNKRWGWGGDRKALYVQEKGRRMWGFGLGTEQLVSGDWVGGIRRDRTEMSSFGALWLSHTHKHTSPPGMMPGHSVTAMPAKPRDSTNSEQPGVSLWSLARPPPWGGGTWKSDKQNIKIKSPKRKAMICQGTREIPNKIKNIKTESWNKWSKINIWNPPLNTTIIQQFRKSEAD